MSSSLLFGASPQYGDCSVNAERGGVYSYVHELRRGTGTSGDSTSVSTAEY